MVCTASTGQLLTLVRRILVAGSLLQKRMAQKSPLSLSTETAISGFLSIHRPVNPRKVLTVKLLSFATKEKAAIWKGMVSEGFDLLTLPQSVLFVTT
jgi:hypothetical protein